MPFTTLQRSTVVEQYITELSESCRQAVHTTSGGSVGVAFVPTMSASLGRSEAATPMSAGNGRCIYVVLTSDIIFESFYKSEPLDFFCILT